LTQSDFALAFLAVSAVSALSVFQFSALPKDAGAELIARKAELRALRPITPEGHRSSLFIHRLK
jgi:hypothetical protein